jgi:hypothetical protein
LKGHRFSPLPLFASLPPVIQAQSLISCDTDSEAVP